MLGAGLGALASDLEFTSNTNPIIVNDVQPSGDDLLVDIAVPAGTPSDAGEPFSVTVHDIGGTSQTHVLESGGILINDRGKNCSRS